MEKILFSVIETAKLLGISKAKVYELIKGGFLHGIDVGGMKISRHEIDTFVEKFVGHSFKNSQ